MKSIIHGITQQPFKTTRTCNSASWQLISNWDTSYTERSLFTITCESSFEKTFTEVSKQNVHEN